MSKETRVSTSSFILRWSIGLACVWLLLFCAASHVHGQAAGKTTAASSKSRVYLIGNSLTWDTVPALLSGDVAWHVDCGKSLQYIYDHPNKPCVPTSTVWPAALEQNRYDFLCVQPHSGTTLSQDVEAIDKWWRLQPQAVLVIHTGWSRHSQVENEFHAQLSSVDGDTKMVHAPAYYEALKRELQTRHPQREIRSTKVMQAIDSIWHDVERKSAPITSLSDLYRDELHLTVQGGRYLAHNMLRRALDQPISSQGFQLEPELKSYLDQKISQIK